MNAPNKNLQDRRPYDRRPMESADDHDNCRGRVKRPYVDATGSPFNPVTAPEPVSARARSKCRSAALDRLCLELVASDPTLSQRLAILTSIPGLGDGTWRGKSFIRGGRAHVRQALYMPALVALRFNEPLKTTYRALIQAGKPAKVAITAIMRKLLVLANALLRENRKWAPCLS